MQTELSVLYELQRLLHLLLILNTKLITDGKFWFLSLDIGESFEGSE